MFYPEMEEAYNVTIEGSRTALPLPSISFITSYIFLGFCRGGVSVGTLLSHADSVARAAEKQKKSGERCLNVKTIQNRQLFFLA